jgi:hypothetical protein
MSHIFSDDHVKGMLRFIASKVKLERLKQPYSMLAPEPFHFERFSKLTGPSPFLAQAVEATGLEMDALHDIYGMPRDIPQMILTMQGNKFGLLRLFRNVPYKTI